MVTVKSIDQLLGSIGYKMLYNRPTLSRKEVELMNLKKVILIVSLITTIITFTFAKEVEDLILYFDYEEEKGGVIADQSGRNYDGKINGNVTIVEDGERGKVAEFKANGFIALDVATITEEDLPLKGMSVLAWFNVENSGDQAIFNARSADGTWLIHPEIRPGVYRWLLRSKGGTIFDMRAGKPVFGKWIHFAGTYQKGEGAVLYINGIDVGKMPGDQDISNNWDQGARVGLNIDNARPFKGMMDELNVWKRGLTQDEVKEIVSKGMKGFLAVQPNGKLAICWADLKK